MEARPASCCKVVCSRRRWSVAAVVVGWEVGGGFGGVLGDVGGDSFGVQLRPVRLPVGGAGDRSGIELGAEPQPPRLIVAVDRRSDVGDVAGGGTDKIGQDVGVDLDGRRPGRGRGRWVGRRGG